MHTHPGASDAPIHLLVNPAAGQGRATDRVREAHEAIAAIGDVQIVETRCAGDEARCAEEAVRQGARALAVLGGDGTVSHAARGLIATGANVPLLPFAAGTGNDFAKTLGAPVHDYPAMARLLAAGRTRRVDAGVVDGVPFVNAAGFGFDAAVIDAMSRRNGQPGQRSAGALAYASAALGALSSYRGFEAMLDSQPSAEGATTPVPQHFLMLVFANGAHFGGAFHIAPDARLDDGALDCVAIGDLSFARRVALFAMAMRGAHTTSGAVRTRTGNAFTLRFAAPPQFEADGELRQAESADVRIGISPGAWLVVA